MDANGSKTTIDGSAESLELVPVGPARGNVLGGKYEVLEHFQRADGRLGYRVRHTVLDAPFMVTAVPAPTSAPAGFLSSVQTVVRDASQLRHRHIVPAVEVIDAADRYYVVESFVDATPLARALRDATLSVKERLQVASQVADALAYAHERNLVHGAVSPANVVLARLPEVRAWLGGFGIAAFPLEGIVSSPGYAAPEQLTGGRVDQCTDVFGLGLVLFELLEGRAFLAGSPRDIENLLRDGAGPLIPRFTRPVPAGVSALVARALRRVPGGRQQRMSHVRSEIDGCLRAADNGTPAAMVSTPNTEPALPPQRTVSSGDGSIMVPELEPADELPAVSAAEPVFAAATDAEAIEVQPFARRFKHDPIVNASADDIPEFVPPPPTYVNPRAATARRGFWPKRERREPTYAPSVLIRTGGPRRRTPIAGKVILGALLVAVGWPLLHLDFTSTASGRSVTPPAEVQLAAQSVPVVEVTVPIHEASVPGLASTETASATVAPAAQAVNAASSATRPAVQAPASRAAVSRPTQPDARRRTPAKQPATRRVTKPAKRA